MLERQLTEEIQELRELRTGIDSDSEATVNVDNEEETGDDDPLSDDPLKVEAGGWNDVTEGITGIEVGLFKHTSELP